MFKLLRTIYQSLTQKEKKFIFLASTLVLLLSSLTFLSGWVFSGNDFFNGRGYLAAPDKMIYLSQIEEAAQGHFLLHNLYTSEPQIGYFSPLWLALGLFSRLTGLAPLLTFHFFRILLGYIFLFLLYFFLAKIFSQVSWRRASFLVLCFSSGLGVFTVFRPWTTENIISYFGSDLWFSEGNVFLTLVHSPLFIFSQICLLLIFWWSLERISQAKWKEVLAVAALALLLGFTHPYDLLIIYVVLGVWQLVNFVLKKEWSWQIALKLAAIFTISALSLLYFLWLKEASPGFAGWADQNQTLSPRILNYLIGYGLIILAFVPGAYLALRSRNQYFKFLALWGLASWLMLYFPIQFQRRLGNSMHLPMVIVGILWLKYLWQKYQASRFFLFFQKRKIIRTFLLEIIIFLLISTNLFLIGTEFFFRSTLRNFFYLTAEEKLGLNWLKQNLSKNDLLLSENMTGNLIPAFTGRYVYLGHGHQTNNWLAKKAKVEEWFFKTDNDDQNKHQWLKREGIDYVYFSSNEKKLGDFNPFRKDYLSLAWQEGEVAIFKVKN